MRSLGVLEREPIRAKIRALTQDDRAELRKQGVRFGAYYIFLPALLKPAARTLALQLWSLQASGDASELLPTLGAVASSGRTSLPLDKGIWKEGYRVAGYRPCGERVVRVDVVERLSGMIRAAFAGEAPGGADGLPSQRTSKGFLVSGAMTSLTGCSGEQFASILRSMGFRSVEMKRSEFFGSQSAAEGARQSEPPKPGDIQEPAGVEHATAPAASEDEAPADSVSAAPVAEPPPDGVLAGAEGLDDLAEGAETAPEDPVAACGGRRRPHRGCRERNRGRRLRHAGNGSRSRPLGSAGWRFRSGEPASKPPLHRRQDARCELAKNAEMIIVWRPDHRKIQRPDARGKADNPEAKDLAVQTLGVMVRPQRPIGGANRRPLRPRGPIVPIRSVTTKNVASGPMIMIWRGRRPTTAPQQTGQG